MLAVRYQSAMVWTAIVWGMSPAEAGDGYGSDLAEPLRYALEEAAPAPERERKVQHAAGIRARTLRLPAVLVDQRYSDAIDADWPWSEPRPELSGSGVGLEFLIRGKRVNGIFYAEYVDSAMQAGYWDRRDTADPLDGTYLAPGRAFGVLAVGATAAYEVHLVRTSTTAGAFGLSLLFGGGLGAGVFVGRLDAWGPDESGNPGYARFLLGQRPDSGFAIPPVIPILDVTAAVRFNVGDRVLATIDGGLHNAPYAGATLSVLY